MSRNKIRIDGDFSGLTKGFNKITKEFKKLDKISIKIDDKDLKSFKKFSIDTWRELHKDVDKYQSKLDKLKQAKLTGTMTQNQIQQEKVLNSLIEKRTQELRKQKDMYSTGNWFQRKGAKMQSGATPGGGMDMMGGVMGGIGNAISAMGPLGMAVGAGAGIYMGARALTAPRRAMADENLKFMGLNRGAIGEGAKGTKAKLEEIRQSGLESGFTPQEAMQAANAMQRNVGDVKGRGEMQSLFNMSRTTGMGTDELSQFAGTYRNAAVTGQGAELQGNLDKTKELYKQAMISALDSSGAIKFMQTTAELTDQIANEGSADTEGIKNTLSQLTLGNDFYKANASRGAAAFQGAEGFFKSGEGTGLALRSMQAAGMGAGMSAPEMLAMQRKGFSEEGGMGSKGLYAITKQLASASAGIKVGDKPMSMEDFEKLSKSQKATAALSISQQMGISQTNAEQLLKQSLTGKEMSGDDIKKMFMSEDEKMVNLQGSMDMNIKKNEAHLQEILLDIGDIITPAIVNMEGYLYKLVDHFTGNAGQKSERVLDIEAKEAQRELSEKRGTTWDTVKSMFGGGAERQANERFAALAKNKIGGGKDLGFNEVEGLVKDSVKGMGDMNLAGLNPEFVKDRAEQITGTRDLLQKNVDERKKQMGYDDLDDAGKRKANRQLFEETDGIKELNKTIERLMRWLDNKPVKPMGKPR